MTDVRFRIDVVIRPFWDGALTLAMMYVFFQSGMWLADTAQKGAFAFNTDEFTLRGLISVQSLREETGIGSSGCYVNDSVSSQQCMFLMRAETTEHYASMVYVVNGDKMLVRGGKWPFAYTQMFDTLSVLEH
jgi:hypothetical protein